MGQEDYQELSSFLRRCLRRLKLLQALEALCLIGICALLVFALGAGVVELQTFFPYAALLYSGLALLVVAAAVGWSVFRLARRVPPERVALFIEQKQPKLRNNLINSLQLYPEIARQAPGFSPSMVLALLRTTRKQVAALKPDELIESRTLKSSLRLFALLLLPVSAMVLFNPSWVGGAINMLTRPLDHLPPTETIIDIEPKGVRVVRGAPVTIQAEATGAIPDSLALMTWSAVDAGGAPSNPEKLPMENLGGGKFRARIARLEKSIHYRAVAGAFASASYSAAAVDPPEIANVRLTLYPPAYTALGSVAVAEGNIEGLKGSTVRLDAVVTKSVVKAEIVAEDGRKLPLKIDGRKLQGNIVLFQSHTYRIAVEDEHGFKNAPITYELKVKPDGFPSVELLQPAQDLEISGDEILGLEYGARDDFGIAELALVVKIGEREDKITLEKGDSKRLIVRDQYKWDLGRLGLREEEEAVFFLQVYDNDTISGPKIGTSRSVRLKLKNLRGEHRQVAEMIRDLNSRMVDLLGDHLEAPAPGEKAQAAPENDKKFAQNLAEAVKRTDEIMARAEKDRMADFATWSDLQALKRNLEFTQNELLRKQEQAASTEERLSTRDQIATELERMSLLSEDIGRRMKAQELASAAQDLARSQERLMDALEKLQSGDKNLDAIMKQIAELSKTLDALQQAAAQLAQQMPDDFMNAESMQGLGFDDMQRALEDIRKKLAQGDFEGARQLARELFNRMAQMVAALQNAQRSAMASSMGRMQGEMQRQSNELQEIAREQQEILLKTEALNNSALSERDAALKTQLDQFLEKAVAELGQLTDLFPDREGPDDPGLLKNLDDATMNALLRNLIAKLSARDFPGFGDGEGLTRKELAKKRSAAQEPRAQRAEKSLAGIKSELDKLLAAPAQALSETDKGSLRELAHRQDVLKERTEELHEKLDSLFQLFPQLDPKIVQNIGEAGKSMGNAHNRLGQLDARGAVPPEQSALERLAQSQQQMQSSMQQMAQRGQLGNMPITRLYRQGRFLPFGSLTPLPGMPQFPEFDIESGFTGLDTEKFRLPGKDEYKAPRNFREEILESLKQGVPPQMKEQIERYFKNLSE